MRLVGSVFLVVLNLLAVLAVESKSGIGSRILEILRGPPDQGPRPALRTALLHCGQLGSDNVDMKLLKSAGSQHVPLLSVHRDQKTWTNILQNLLLSYPDHMVSIVLDLTCPAAKNALIMADQFKMFGSPYRWLLVYPTSNETYMSLERCAEQAKNLLGSLAVLLDSEVISMCRYGESGGSGQIIEWYRLYLHERSFMGDLGSWRDQSPIKWTERASKPMALRRMNLQKTKLYVGFILRYNETLKHLDDGVESRKDTITKYIWPLMHNSMIQMNATLVPKFANSWGYPINKSMKNWDGLVGMQQRGEIDISALPALMERIRNTVVSFVNFDAPTRGIFIFRAPPMTYEANLFALPFPDTLWAAAGGLVVACILLLFLVLTTEDIMDEDHPRSIPFGRPLQPKQVSIQPEKPTQSKQFLSPAPTDEESDENIVAPVTNGEAVGGDGIQAKARLHGSWSDVILLVFGAICQQGSPVEARTIPARIVTISMLIGIMFLFTSYSASIVVLLQSTSNSIQTVDDLWKSRLPAGAEDVGYNRFLLAQMAEKGGARKGVYKKITKKNKKNPSGSNFMTLEAGMERVRKDYFAFHALETSMFPIISDTWQEHEKCALKAHITNMIYPQIPDINLHKHSPLLEVFRLTLRKQVERGIKKRERSRTITQQPVCTNPGSNFSSVSVMDSYFTLVILTAGIFGSLLVLILEHLAFRRLKKAAKGAEAAARAASRITRRILSSKRI